MAGRVRLWLGGLIGMGQVQSSLVPIRTTYLFCIFFFLCQLAIVRR